MKKTLFCAVLLLAARSHAFLSPEAQKEVCPAGGKSCSLKFSGSGTWVGFEGNDGTFDSTLTLSPTKVSNTITYENGYEESFEFHSIWKKNGTFTIVDENAKKLGLGYCKGPFCQFTAKIKVGDETLRVHQTIHLKKGKACGEKCGTCKCGEKCKEKCGDKCECKGCAKEGSCSLADTIETTGMRLDSDGHSFYQSKLSRVRK